MGPFPFLHGLYTAVISADCVDCPGGETADSLCSFAHPSERREAELALEPPASMDSTTTGEHRECIISDRRVRVRRLSVLRSLARLHLMGGRGMTGRESAEALCRRCIGILDANLPDDETIRQLRDLFDIPDADPQPVMKREWPVLRAAEPYDPRD